MISSVIAKLNCASEKCLQLIDELAAHPAIEVGDIVGGHSLPATIDASGNRETEEITRWMLGLDGVAFVDVVCVHFEEDDEHITTRKTEKY